LNSVLERELSVLLINLLKRFDVLAHEAYRHREHRANALLPELLQALVRVRLQPLDGSNARLVRELVSVVQSVPALELAHDQVDTLLHLLPVRVAGVLYIRLGHAMSAEEHNRLVRLGEAPRLELAGDYARHRADVAWTLVPRRNDDVLKLAQLRVVVHLALKEAERRPAG